ncbi:uncharacterized protein RJT21DRAFT_128616 [Scheffersomyces amazonensis]|uniref:uncharacterized protein n=1 Tax=Scheffersomyces amazonensis TaxID=1078765 RepID=UPI00315DD118
MTEEFDSRRKELYSLNSAAWEPDYQYAVDIKLDPSLKKNTAFIKKVRTNINGEQYKSVIKDIETISLEKYLSEIITSLAEGLFKVSKHDDIVAAVEVVSLLHQRFGLKLTPYLLSTFLHVLANPDRQQLQLLSEQEREREALLRVTRQKNMLRLFAEFYVVGIFRTLGDISPELIPEEILKRISKSSSESVLTIVLKNLLNFEILTGNSLTIVLSFLKRFRHIIRDNNNMLLSINVKDMIRNIFQVYSNAISNIVIDLDSEIYNLKKRNTKASIRTGRILEENVVELNQAEELFEKFQSGNEYIASVFNFKLPTLSKKSEISTEESTIEVVKQKNSNEEDFGVWGDAKEKLFYTKIPTYEELNELYPPDEDDEEVLQGNNDGGRVTYFLSKLQVASEEDIDSVAAKFLHLGINNKATWNRLFKFFVESPDVNNLRYFARFLKIHEEALKESISSLIDYLDRGFRYQIYNEKLNFKNIFFFVELIKFKLIPSHIIFHKIRTLTLNITSTNNIDVLSVFYEHIGRFLLQEPEYKQFTQEMISNLRDKKRSSNFKVQEKMAINNLLLTIDPPVINGIKIEDRMPILTDEEKFIQRLLRVELNDRSCTLIANEISKLDLIKNESFIVECFSHPDLINYNNIHALAFVLKAIQVKNIIIRTIDFLIENIIRGMEENDYRRNRIRMAHIKYVAEIFNLRLINFKFINTLLNKILCYGHPNNQPLPGNYSLKLDPPDNYFRIQLCCLLLVSIDDGKGSSRSRSRSRSRKSRRRSPRINKDLLKTYFAFFQYYVFCKQMPIPIDLEFKLHDLFEKYGEIPGIERYQSLGETLNKLKEIVEKKGLGTPEDDDEEEEDSDDDIDIDNDSEVEEEEEDSEDDEDDEDDEEEGDLSDDELSDDASTKLSTYEHETEEAKEEKVKDDEYIARDVRKSEGDSFADALAKEYQKILVESYETNLKNVTSKNTIGNPNSKLSLKSESIATSENGKVQFKLLTKDGKSPKKLALPSDNKFAASVLKERDNLLRDKERIMKLALDMD